MSSVPCFDHNYLEYDSWFEENAAIYRAEVRVLGALLPNSGKIIEIGVGTGRFAALLKVPFGVEPSRNMALLARSRGIAVCQAFGELLPFPGESFDCVVLVTVLCFIEEERPFIKECRRLIRPRGHLLIGMIDPQSHLGAVYEACKSDDIFYRFASFRSVEHMVSLVKDSGFEIVDSRQTILGMPHQASEWDDIRDGYGAGAFVGLLARITDS
jgi:SAM-dependent methyltransferase